MPFINRRYRRLTSRPFGRLPLGGGDVLGLIDYAQDAIEIPFHEPSSRSLFLGGEEEARDDSDGQTDENKPSGLPLRPVERAVRVAVVHDQNKNRAGCQGHLELVEAGEHTWGQKCDKHSSDRPAKR